MPSTSVAARWEYIYHKQSVDSNKAISSNDLRPILLVVVRDFTLVLDRGIIT